MTVKACLFRVLSFILIVSVCVLSQVGIGYAKTTTCAPRAENIIITNNAGKVDTINITDLYGGEVVKVYNSASEGKILSSVSVPLSRTEITMNITQLGKAAGSVYISFTGKGELESTRTKVNYSEEVKSDTPDADNIIVTNNAGKSDIVNVTDLYGGEVVKVYNSASGGKLLGSMSVPLSKTEATITITQLGKAAGSIYVSITNKGELESDRAKADYLAEPKAAPIDAGSITITNNAGIPDTIRVNYLSLGDTVKVYDSASGGNLLGSATVPSSKTEVSMTIAQLSKMAGSVYVSLTSKGMLESNRTKVDYPAEFFSNAPYAGNVTVVNNAGMPDTVGVANLNTGDEVRVYDSVLGGNLLGSATVSSSQATITISQLGTAAGSIYVSVISKGKFESDRTKVSYSAEPNSNVASVDNITITNNAGKADTVKVTGLAAGDVVKMYDSASGGNLLGTATVPSSGTEATITIAQLGKTAGSIYISTTSKGKMESDRIKVSYPAELVSDTIDANDVTVVNNPAGKSDTVNITNLTGGDAVKVYDSASGGNILGTATVPSSKTEATVTISQLGIAAGSVYISVASTNKNESGRTKVDYSAESKSDAAGAGDIVVTNNVAGTSDTVEVTDLAAGDVVKVYDSAVGGKLLGSATVPASGSYTTVTVSQLGTTAGSIYVSVTGTNKLESDRIKVDYAAESKSEAAEGDNITIINNAGASDTVEVTNITAGDVVKVYDSAAGGKMLGSATVPAYGTYTTVTVSQLGTTAGSVYVSVTGANKLESDRVRADYSAESKSNTASTENILITNNAGNSDTVQVTGLDAGDQVKVYEAPKGGTLLGSGTVSTGSTATINITQLGSAAGSIYISVTSKNKLEGDRMKADYSAEDKSGALLEDNVTVTNNVGSSDIVRITGLTGGDVVNIYDSAKAGTLLGTATASTYDTWVEITITQLGSAAGSIYISVTGKNKLESDRTKADYSAEAKSDAPSEDNITIVNNAGMSDTVKITGLTGDDVVNIYDSAKAGNLLGTATVSTYDVSVSVTITQLGSAAGSIFVSVTGKSRLESNRTKADYSAEPKSDKLLASNIVIINNAGISDTVKVTGLSGGETINVYDSAVGGSLLGFITAETYDSYATAVITQLGTSAGSVYISITKKGYQESDRIKADYTAEPKSDSSDSRNIVVTNNAGAPDTVQINGLSGGDTVYVYDAASGGTLLGSETVPTYDSHVTITITQLKTSGGNIYVSVKSKGKLESDRTIVMFAAEQKSDPPMTSNITVVNNAGISDTVKVTFLYAYDLIKIYDKATGGNLLGSATVSEGSTEVTVKITQLGISNGKIYVSVTSANKLESERTVAYYTEEPTSDTPESGNIKVVNNAKIADTVTVTFLNVDDVVKVYSSATGESLIGSETVTSGNTQVSVSIAQLSTSAGSIYVTVTSVGKKESTRVKIDYSEEQKSDPPAVNNIIIKNNAGMADTVTVTFLDAGDSIKVYDSASGGNLLGSATVPNGGTEATIKVSQLGTSNGVVYITVTGSGKLESDRTMAYYTEEVTSDAPYAANIIVTNNAGKSDTVKVTELEANDIVRVYSSASQGSLLGSGSVPADSTEVTIKITQIGTGAGSIYVSVTSTGAYESIRTKADYSAES